jgi:hypothetical protein
MFYLPARRYDLLPGRRNRESILARQAADAALHQRINGFLPGLTRLAERGLDAIVAIDNYFMVA